MRLTPIIVPAEAKAASARAHRTLRTSSACLPSVPGVRHTRSVWVVAVVVGLLAVAVRLRLMGVTGLTGYGGYDDGVYYAASADLLHGLIPYRDVLLLHPPGIMLVLAPFLWLGEHTSDTVGFVTARVVFMVLGGLIAALIALFLSRWGAIPAWTGGLTYAVLFPAAYSERTTQLEPIGSLAMVLALVLVPRRGATRLVAPGSGRRRPRVRHRDEALVRPPPAGLPALPDPA